MKDTLDLIEQKLAVLEPDSVELIDDSAKHAGHAGAKGGGQQVAARLDAPLLEGLAQGDGHGGGRGVAVVLDVDHHLVHVGVHALGEKLDDAVLDLLQAVVISIKHFLDV